MTFPVPGTSDFYTQGIKDEIYSPTSAAWAFGVGSGSNTYAIDTATNRYYRYAFVTAETATFNFTNMVDGREVSLCIKNGASGLTAVNFQVGGTAVTVGNGLLWWNTTAPTLTAANTLYALRFRWDSSVGLICISKPS